jgi:hypothetical protein
MTQTTRDNGARRASRPTCDPGYRPTRPAQPNGFWPLLEHGLTVCAACASLVPASERAQQRHRQWHEQLRGLEDGRPR